MSGEFFLTRNGRTGLRWEWQTSLAYFTEEKLGSVLSITAGTHTTAGLGEKMWVLFSYQNALKTLLGL